MSTPDSLPVASSARPGLKPLEILGSLYVALALMPLLVATLVWGTVLEERYGAGVARFGIYGAWWFTLLWTLLGLNVFAAVMARFPWSRGQLGFLVAHLGILLLLVGFLVGGLFGVEAMLPVAEHRSAGMAQQESVHFELTVVPTAGRKDAKEEDAQQSAAPREAERVLVPFHPGPFNWSLYDELPWFPWRLAYRSRGTLYRAGGIRLEVIDYYGNSTSLPIPRVDLRVEPVGGDGLAAGAASRVSLGVEADAGQHGRRNLYGRASRAVLDTGHQVAFWMTRHPDETAAFQRAKLAGPPSDKGTVLLFARGEMFTFALDDWKPGERRPLGKTGLEAELVKTIDQMFGVLLRIHGPGGEPETIFLLAEWPHAMSQWPHLSQPDYVHGVFGSFWRKSTKPEGKDEQESSLRGVGSPRIEVLQGADQKLSVRTWRDGKLEPAVVLPADGTPVTLLVGTPDAVALSVESFQPSAWPASVPVPLPLDRMQASATARQALVRLTVDEKTEEFWLAVSPAETIDGHDPAGQRPSSFRRTVVGEKQTVMIDLRPDVLDLGVDIRLQEFRRRRVPGTEIPMEFASVVDVVARADGERQREKVLVESRSISMNHPLSISDPATWWRTFRLFQSDFRGPQPPEAFGHSSIEKDEGSIYVSYLSVASDPGRWLKYLGCILIVGGVFMRYYVRLKPRVPVACLALFAVLGIAGSAGAAESIDLGAWQRLPVFDNGRVMPLDTFSRVTAKDICGSPSPWLSLDGAFDGVDKPAAATIRELEQVIGPQGRRFDPSELLLSWLAEPEKWEHIPFLPASDEYLRRELLGLRMQDDSGRPLRYVSPRQILAAARFRERLEQIGRWQDDTSRRQRAFTSGGIDQKVNELYEAYAHFRQLTYNPRRPAEGRSQFNDKIIQAIQTWNRIEEEVLRLPLERGGADGVNPANRVSESIRKLAQVVRPQQEPSLAELEPLVASLAESTADVAARLADLRDTARRAPDPQQGDAMRFRMVLGSLAEGAEKTARLVGHARAALYESNPAVRVLPGLDPSALEADRYRSDAPPWLSLQTVLFAPQSMLRRYPQTELAAARQSFETAIAAYRDRENAGRGERFAKAIDEFAASVRAMGQSIESLRGQLPIREKDDWALAATAYPPPGSTSAEVFYNQFDPFHWSWVVCAVALVAFILSAIRPIARPAFWLGVVALVAALVLILTGLLIRGYISGWVPVTSMFETIIFVAMCTAILGLALTLLPPRNVMNRRAIAGVGALMTLVCLLAACHVPTFHKEIEPLRAVLRSNFWLAVHVKTIVAGYGVAAMAWGLGNLAMLYYLFARYPVTTSSERDSPIFAETKSGTVPLSGGRGPEFCVSLGLYSYRFLQVAVILLMAGTILGGMWADDSWGRFWGWDPKEVWALISILAYMIVLHLRHVGLTGGFSLAFGSVVGGLAILWTWYGVNFIMRSGKHAYGQGSGGNWALFALLAIDAIFLAAATVRYVNEQRAVGSRQ